MAVQPQRRQAGGVGADQQAVARPGQQAFAQRAQALGLRVQAQAQAAGMPGVEQPVLDHARRRARQPQRVAQAGRVVGALLARDVERAHQPAGGVDDGRGGAGEEAVALQVVLAAVHHHRRLFGQRGADGVGAAPGLGPLGAGAQRHALGAAGHVSIAQGAQQHALRIGQDQQAGRAGHLLGHVVEHRLGMRQQLVLPLHRPRQLCGRRMRRAVPSALRRQPGLRAALPAARQHLAQQRRERRRQGIGRPVGLVSQAAPGVAQAGTYARLCKGVDPRCIGAGGTVQRHGGPRVCCF